MTNTIRPLLAGNWKMNGTRASLDQIKAIADGVKAPLSEKIDTLLCPRLPCSTLRPRFATTARSPSAPRIAISKSAARIRVIFRPK